MIVFVFAVLLVVLQAEPAETSHGQQVTPNRVVPVSGIRLPGKRVIVQPR